MSEKRFTLLDETIFDNEKQAEDGGRVTYWVISYGQRQRLVDLLNELSEENVKLRAKIEEQQDQISFWKHKVSSLLWILGQFDEEKVKKLLKELENE